MPFRLAVLVLVSAVVPAARAAAPACDPSPAAAVLLEDLPDLPAIAALSAEDREERLSAVEAALAESPGDLFLHRLRQDLYRFASKDVRDERMPEVREEYARLAGENPGDAAFLYLHGRIADEERDEAFAAAVDADPDFPLGRLAMVGVELARGEVGKDAAEAHLARFIELCPHRPREILLFGSSAGSSAFWEEHLPPVRRQLEEDPAGHATAFTSLWALEFRLADVTEHDAVRERVARDVERLAALEERPRTVLAALKEGYELSGQPEAAAAVEREMVAASPCSDESVFATIEAWEAENPRPDAGAEGWAAWGRTLDEAAREWVERCPGRYLFWSSRLEAMMVMEEPDPAELLAVGLRSAELYGQWRGASSPSGYEQVAMAFLLHEVGIEHVPELLDQADAEARARREGRDLERYPEEMRPALLRSDLVHDWGRDALRARTHVARGELDVAERLLGELGERLDEIASHGDGTGKEVAAQRGRESELWKMRAALAEAAGHLPDALAYLLQAEATRPTDAPLWVQGLRPKEAEERIPELWSRLGGSPDALAALRGSTGARREVEAVEDYSPWEVAEGELPDFELEDLSGRVWTRAELAGKTVFVNAWATWCGPCRSELPAVQALHERFRERDDVAVVTLNMDSQVGVVAPFLEREELRFPVLLAEEYLREEMEVFGIPQSWIVDANGSLRRRQSGFDSAIPEEEWLDQTVAEMERVAAGGAAADGSGSSD